MSELLPGIYHWTAAHPKIKVEHVVMAIRASRSASCDNAASTQQRATRGLP